MSGNGSGETGLTIPQMPVAGVLTGNELLYLVQNNQDVRSTVSNLSTFLPAIYLPLTGGTLIGNLRGENITPPQNNIEVEFNGFAGNPINLSGAQTWTGFWAHSQIHGATTTPFNSYIFTTNCFFSTANPGGHFNLIGNCTVQSPAAGGFTGVQGHINAVGGSAVQFMVGVEGSTEANNSVGGTALVPFGYLAGMYAQAVLNNVAMHWQSSCRHRDQHVSVHRRISRRHHGRGYHLDRQHKRNAWP